jgi:hypothetical protein
MHHNCIDGPIIGGIICGFVQQPPSQTAPFHQALANANVPLAWSPAFQVPPPQSPTISQPSNDERHHTLLQHNRHPPPIAEETDYAVMRSTNAGNVFH